MRCSVAILSLILDTALILDILYLLVGVGIRPRIPVSAPNTETKILKSSIAHDNLLA